MTKEKHVQTIKVFMASPGDLAVERETFRDVADEINVDHSESSVIRLEAVGWVDTLLAAEKTPQNRINEIVDTADIFVLVLKRRWGRENPDSQYSSYAEDEFNSALKNFHTSGKPEIFIFFEDLESEPTGNQEPKLKKVLDFRRKIQELGFLHHTYQNQSDFRIKLKGLLGLFVKRLSSAYSKPIATDQSHGDSISGSEEIKAFGVFEGGGAKGLAHVGALRAAEDYEVSFSEVAGASAGSIVASLIACGYKSRELFDPENPHSGLLDIDFVQFLGRFRWKLIKTVRRASVEYNGSIFIRILCLCTAFSIFALIFYGGFKAHELLLSIGWNYFILLLVGLLFIGLLLFLIVNNYCPKGIFSSDKFEVWLNSQMQARLKVKSDVMFEDLPISLRVIVTDIRERTSVQFSKESEARKIPEERISVARAVAYSISIPFAFRPHDHGDSFAVDGGVLSNFPAWVFDDIRTPNNQAIPTIGFRLQKSIATENKSKKSTLWEYLKGLSTVFFGDNVLQTRAIDDLFPIPIVVSASTLDFHLDHQGRKALFTEGYFSSSTFFKNYRGRKNGYVVELLLKKLHDDLRVLMNDGDGRIRISIAQPVEPNRRKIRVTYRFNMVPSDCDDMLVLPIGAGVMGRSWTIRKPVLVKVNEVVNDLESWGMTKYDQALVWKDMNTLISLPMFATGSIGSMPGKDEVPVGILNIDTDRDYFGRLTPLVEDRVSDLGNMVGSSIRAMVKELKK